MSADRPIERSRAFVLLVPRGSLDDQMVADIARARRARKPIVAVLRSGYTMPQGLDDAHIVRADTPATIAKAIAELLEGLLDR